jgi:hypothetical protein
MVLSASAIRMRAVRSALPKGTCGKNYLMRNELVIDYLSKLVCKNRHPRSWRGVF